MKLNDFSGRYAQYRTNRKKSILMSKTTNKQERGYVIWKGNSKVDDKEIVSILTMKSSNRKTGDMPQLWVIKTDVSPVDARKNNSDISNCAFCKCKENCYVNRGKAPLNIYKSFNLDKYSVLEDIESIKDRYEMIRLGAFGEALLIPIDKLDRLIFNKKWKCYTHMWSSHEKVFDNDEFEFSKRISMASVNSLEEKVEANDLGYKTFRVTTDLNDKTKDEVICPYIINGTTTCDNCNFCCGNNSSKCKNILVLDHGPKNRKGYKDFVNDRDDKKNK